MNKEQVLVYIASVSAVIIATGCQAPHPQGAPAAEVETQVRPEAPNHVLHPRVQIKTTLGDIVVELDGEKAPGTVLNFIQHVQSSFYEGVVFHRVLNDKMIQGGEFTADMEPKLKGLRPPPQGAWLSKLTNEQGTIAAIRGRGETKSASGQFYINMVDNPDLDSPEWKGIFSVFGSVVEGMDTVERIRNAPVGPHPKYAQGRSAVVPVEPIVIKSTTLLTPFSRIQAQAVLAAEQTEREQTVDQVVQQLEEKTGSKAVTTESGLRYIDLVVGKGASPPPTATIEFQYRGTLVDGTEFESTYETEPAVRQIPLLIPGLQEGLSTMSEGGKRIMIIPPDLGFGENGIPRLIPPDSHLIFEIELLSLR
jgi:FKBP-type peptidyl-prolyl cis-trans isomerase